jgi:hypothetical protein
MGPKHLWPTSNLCSITSQKNEDLEYITEEAWNLEEYAVSYPRYFFFFQDIEDRCALVDKAVSVQ